LLEFPPDVLNADTNTFMMHSETEHHMLEVLWPGPAIVARIAKPTFSIRDDTYQDRDHFVIHTKTATYWLDKNSGGISRLIDRQGKDWIAFKKEPWGDYPDAAASSFRGLPNLLFAQDEDGFGHPGWDRGTSVQTGDRTIQCTSNRGDWKLVWTFADDHVDLDVETKKPNAKYWFLYEGTIAGRWAPKQQYFATNTLVPVTDPHDYQAGDRIGGTFRWAYFGDSDADHLLYIVHDQSDDLTDQFSHLGNTKTGLDSPDGMVVFGFGRGLQGIDPQLTGNNSFRLGLLHAAGKTPSQYDVIKTQLNSILSTTSNTQP
jgi:hypothetical protein